MNYSEAIEYLYNHAPMFQQHGHKAYKSGLDNTLELDEHFGHPHTQYKTIHVAGTNGKGSTSHLIASVLQCAGYKVGLYTSPHLRDFRERIRVNGEMISQQRVIDFIEANQAMIDHMQPSFFEITTALAFAYFAECKVDIAVIEVGLGGRLDCTNIINPILSIITNISLDHTDILGDTLEKIATEKAGIIKPNTPIVIGETQPEIVHVFNNKARELNAPIVYADKIQRNRLPECELQGIYQEKNKRTVLAALEELQQLHLNISGQAINDGFAQVIERTHLMGRWQTLCTNPRIICDTGHNEGGLRYVSEQLQQQKCDHLRIIFGMVSDKNHAAALALLPKNAIYYFTKANSPRAWSELELQAEAATYNLHGQAYSTVAEALAAAKRDYQPNDLIFIGGSNYVIAEII